MNNYCVYFCLKNYKDIDKIKIDYYTIPVERKDNLFKSLLSEETFKINEMKCKDHYFVYFKKQKDIVECRMIFENISLEFEEAEKMLIPIAHQYIKSKIPFRFKFKEALNLRVSQLLN